MNQKKIVAISAILVIGLFMFLKGKQSKVVYQEPISIKQKVDTHLESTPTVGSTTTVTNSEKISEEKIIETKLDKVLESELKEMRYCSPKSIDQCVVCLSNHCEPDSEKQVTCYTLADNCDESKNHRRLSMTEIKNFDKIMANNYK